MHKAVDNLRKRYHSNLLGFYLGSVPTFIAFDYETIKETENRPEFNLDISMT
jgi:hypothetical protein